MISQLQAFRSPVSELDQSGVALLVYIVKRLNFSLAKVGVVVGKSFILGARSIPRDLILRGENETS